MIRYIEEKLLNTKLYQGFMRYQFEFDWIYRHMFEYDKLEFLVKFVLGLIAGKKELYMHWYHMDIFMSIAYNSDTLPLSERTRRKVRELEHKYLA